MADDKQVDTAVYARIMQLLQGGLYSEAERACELVLRSGSGASHLLWSYLGVARQFQGKLIQALEAFWQAHAMEAGDIEVVNACASCLSQLERHQEAYDMLLMARQLAPESATVNANLGVGMERLGRLKEALPYYDKALAYDTKNEIALTNRGTLLTKLGRHQEGLQHNREAHALCPQVFGMLYNLVDSLIGLFQYEEALAHCDAGLAWMPRHAYMLFKKGMILSCLRRFEEAQKYLALAQVIEPAILRNLLPNLRQARVDISLHADARIFYFEAMYQQQLCCFWRDRGTYIESINAAIRLPEVPYALIHGAEFGFQSFSLEIDPNARLKLAENIGNHVRDITWLTGTPPFKFKPHNKKRLKVGYISPDFRQHPVGYLSRQIYGLHTREKFEIFAYSLFDVKTDDRIYQDIKRACDVFRDVAELNSIDIANLIHHDEIDILVDLAGYTTNARPEITALRPAPLQILQNGYLEGMGGGIVDYVVTDAYVYPVGGKNFWRERAIRLPHHTLPYDNEVDNAPTNAKRRDFDLPEDAFVFCCLNNSYKIEPEIFGIWMNILKAVPGSVLWLAGKNEQIRINLQNEALQRGIEIDRLIFAPFLNSVTEHCLRYQIADMFLDTLWHNAQTTALDALWQGLPLLTREGNSVSSRAGASCLQVLGLTELITQDVAEYQRKAIYYAQHPEELRVLRERLKSARYSSALFNIELMVKHLESAYETAWQRYQAGLPPETINVPNLEEVAH